MRLAGKTALITGTGRLAAELFANWERRRYFEQV